MRKAHIFVHNIEAGILEEDNAQHYFFHYHDHYHGAPVSLTMPITRRSYEFDKFPPFFEGLLPEGMMLDGLLRRYKLDKRDYFSQLMKVGSDVVGAVTIKEDT